MKKLLFLLCITLIAAIYGGDVQVVFSVNMKAQIIRNLFNPAADSVCVRGDFQIPAGDPDGNWQGNRFRLRDPESDSIYSVVVNLPNRYIDSLFQYKFVKNNDYWEFGDNRNFILRNLPRQELCTYWFNNDSNLVLPVVVTNTFVFTADMSADYGHGYAYFDPDTDSILVQGMDWDGLGLLVSGNRKMHELSEPPKRFRTALVVKGLLRDSTKWKFKVYPESKYGNSGWELGTDHWLHYAPDGDTVFAPEMIPNTVFLNYNGRIYNSTFRVNMKRQIAEGKFRIGLDSLFVRGTFQRIARDTCRDWEGYTFKLSDTDADSIYSITIPLTYIDVYRLNSYRYLIDTGYIETSPLWWFCVDLSNTLLPVVWFNNLPLAVNEKIIGPNEKSWFLLRGYPNPFNPDCNIIFTVQQSGHVSLVVYDALGREIERLVDEAQAAGTHSVTWRAAAYSSGAYFCRVTAGGRSSAMKLVLLK